ncbi:queuine tRNA-ribosyltransferase, putative [Plasmodium ovale]|uniref:Queuine tRNA-ribosyltransferase, putative n=1 Tax=Plasmodium ovale TaxID=36330 RepID=A0A1D3UAQ7_PLAOA|nr:queuine tRNA-ribosyltransferase, putative [Plasmodium ovale]
MKLLIVPILLACTLFNPIFAPTSECRIVTNEGNLKGRKIAPTSRKNCVKREVRLCGSSKVGRNGTFVRTPSRSINAYENKRDRQGTKPECDARGYRTRRVIHFDCYSMDYPNFDFTLLKENRKEGDRSRIGVIRTPRGDIETPNFIFCATKGCMKSTPIDFIRNCKTQVILSNTFHLLIQPKPHTIFQLGGLHKFMNWQGPILTDSGGYQLFSMTFGSVSDEIKRRGSCAPDGTKGGVVKVEDDYNESDRGSSYGNSHRNGHRSSLESSLGRSTERIAGNTGGSSRGDVILKISEMGALYRSYSDGSVELLSPEASMQSQYLLGSDFAVVFDECTPYHVEREYTEKAMHRSHRWYIRCLFEFYRARNMPNYHDYLNELWNNKYKTNDKWEKREKNRQALYGVIQGGIYTDLRKLSCDVVCNLPFFGICIGGCLGVNKEMMYSVIKETMNFITVKKPIHLLGIGQIRDIFFGVRQGIDTFDCVIPTRLARHGYFLCKIENMRDIEKKIGRPIKNEYIKIKLSIFKYDNNPLEKDCSCYTCLHYTRAYLHHLFKIRDNLVGTLLTVHNVQYMNQLMADIRKAIKEENMERVERRYLRCDCGN